MSDPRRLLSAESDDFEKELLGSWGREQPSEAARSSVLAVVSVSAATGAAKGVVSGSVAPKAASAAGTAVLKWLAIAAVGIAATGASVQLARRFSSAGSSATPRTEVSPRVADIASTTAPSLTLSAPPAPPPLARVPEARAPRPHTSSSERAPAPSALGEQVATLDRARADLAAGDGAAALREIDAYEGRFPRGALIEEAEVLRVEALLAQGNRAAAAKVGARFLAAHESSPHAARVRALLAGAP